MTLTLRFLDDEYAICRLNKVPVLSKDSPFLSLTITEDEISLVCSANSAPDDGEVQKGWRAFKIEGQLDFSLVGILSKISTVLADAAIPIFVVSTYNTDYILVELPHLERGISALKDAGYNFVDYP